MAPEGAFPVKVFRREGAFSVHDADPIIRRHAIYWLLCLESNAAPRRYYVDGDWKLFYHDAETCAYHRGCNVVFAFRGTKRAKDLYDDRQIVLGRTFPRAREASRFIVELMKLNPYAKVELTGHSLGGAVAREVGKSLGLTAITFNAGAPPSAPAVSGRFDVNYHIVFDLISAWQSPNTVRIDKGFRPISGLWISMVPHLWVWTILGGVLPAHKLMNFSKFNLGVVVTPGVESGLIHKWFVSLPAALRLYLVGFLLGVSGNASVSLPTVE